MIRRFVLERDLAAKMKRDWDIRGRLDPMWYIASSRHDWNPKEFFESGYEVVNQIQAEFFYPIGFDSSDKCMLDIGCGIGRMTLAFAKLFREVHGTDVSPVMLEQAVLNAVNYSNVYLTLGNGINLSQYTDASFDFCFSHLMLMHIPQENIILGYIREIGRVLKDGGLFRFDLSNNHFAKIKRWVFTVIAIGYRNVKVRIPWMEQKLLDSSKRIFQFETIDGAAISLGKLGAIMKESGLVSTRISGTETRIMLVEGVKRAGGK
jgi:ubiquinone/menaquinone biosynthesis C-methylase UbiE